MSYLSGASDCIFNQQTLSHHHLRDLLPVVHAAEGSNYNVLHKCSASVGELGSVGKVLAGNRIVQDAERLLAHWLVGCCGRGNHGGRVKWQIVGGVHRDPYRTGRWVCCVIGHRARSRPAVARRCDLRAVGCRARSEVVLRATGIRRAARHASRDRQR